MTDIGPLEIIKLAIYYASYFYFIAAPLAVWIIVRRAGAARYLSAAFLAVISCFAYARFIEPRILLTAEHDVALKGCFDRAGAMRVAVFSDAHIGIFGNAMPVQRIVARVNAAQPDFTLIAGDYIYFLHPDLFEKKFAAFADLRAPAFAVFGNHDIGLPGPDLSAPLETALPRLGLRLIDNSALRLSNSKFDIELVGLSDSWGRNQKLSLLKKPAARPRIVLTHNPGTIRDFRPGMRAELLVGGHTHGGQIQLPYLTCAFTSFCGDVAYGLREGENRFFRELREATAGPPISFKDITETLVFTTSGAGMVGLPMRFRVPPRIDILNIKYDACAAD